MNNPFNSNDQWANQGGPVVIPPQGNAPGVNPPSSGAVRGFNFATFFLFTEMESLSDGNAIF